MENSSGKIWEVKPETWSQAEAEAQLKGYTNGKFLGEDILKYSPVVGGYEGFMFVGSFQQDIYNIDYWYSGNGVIKYSYSVNKEELIRQIEAAGKIASEAVIAAAGMPVPLFI